MPSFGIRLGKLIADFRAANEMSQKDLAIAAFDDEAQRFWVSKLEGGKVQRPHERKVDALRLALGIPLETIDEIRDPSDREVELLQTEQEHSAAAEKAARESDAYEKMIRILVDHHGEREKELRRLTLSGLYRLKDTIDSRERHAQMKRDIKSGRLDPTERGCYRYKTW